MTEVAFDDLIFEIFRAVAVRNGCCGFHYLFAILPCSHVRIIERVDVNGKPSGVLGKMFATRDHSITKTTGVVVAHLSFVVSIIVISQTYPLDRVVLAV